MTHPLLDPAAVQAAGAGHGILASRITGGGLAVSGHKHVEEGMRALVLIVPGLFRFDVKPDQDTLEVRARELVDAHCEWTMTDLSANYNRAQELREPVDRMIWDIAIHLEPRQIRGRIVLHQTADRERGVYHVLAHATLFEAPA